MPHVIFIAILDAESIPTTPESRFLILQKLHHVYDHFFLVTAWDVIALFISGTNEFFKQSIFQKSKLISFSAHSAVPAVRHNLRHTRQARLADDGDGEAGVGETGGEPALVRHDAVAPRRRVRTNHRAVLGLAEPQPRAGTVQGDGGEDQGVREGADEGAGEGVQDAVGQRLVHHHADDARTARQDLQHCARHHRRDSAVQAAEVEGMGAARPARRRGT